MLAVVLLVGAALQARPVGSAVLTNLGMVALSATGPGAREPAFGDTAEQAEKWFTRALLLDAGNRGAHRGLGWIREAQGSLSQAAHEWRQGGFTVQEFLVCAQRAARVGKNDLEQLWMRRAEALRQETSQTVAQSPRP